MVIARVVEAWDNYTISLSYPTQMSQPADPSTLKNGIIDFERRWLVKNYPDLLRYARCHHEKPALLSEISNSTLLAGAVAWVSFSLLDYVSPAVLIVSVTLSAFWCWGQHRRYANDLREFCGRYLDEEAQKT